VTFRYRIDGSEVLHDVPFSVEPNQVIGIVGSSGSGKSTIAKMIQRLYVPESGCVLVDGVDLAMVDLPWLRRQIGVVLQEKVLFNRSIRETNDICYSAETSRQRLNARFRVRVSIFADMRSGFSPFPSLQRERGAVRHPFSGQTEFH
jgi:ABC-type bacteriocin/lantibiotic exporter with double-glycine peptidase domain